MRVIGYTLLNMRNNCCIKDGYFTIKRELAEFARLYKTWDEAWEDCEWWRNKDIPVIIIEVTKETDMDDALLLERLQTARKIHNFAWMFEIKAGMRKRIPLIEDQSKSRR